MKLLIVDDHPFNLHLLRAQLEAEGHGVIEATNGVEALAALSGEPVDGVVSDILMPEMDGFRLCMEVRKDGRLKSLPFVFYTSTYDSPADRRLAQDLGVDAYITKPSPVSVVLDALGEAKGRAGREVRPVATLPDEGHVLKQYSQALVRKLEDKNTDLEATLANLNTAHEETRRADERYRAMFEKAAVGMTHSDLEGRLVTVNPRFCEIVGYTLAEALQLNYRDLTHPEDVERSKQSRAALLEADAPPYEREVRLLRKDRTVIWARITTSLMRTGDSKPLHFLSVIYDVTERKLAEDARRESEARLNEAQRNARLGSWSYKADGTFAWSDQMYELIQLPRGVPVTHEAIASLVHPDDRVAGDESPFVRAVRTGATEYTTEYRAICRDGGILNLHALGKIRRDPQGLLIEAVGTVQDITERKTAQRRIERLNRVYAVLSQINSLIVRVRDREVLFRDACRIAVKAGGFRAAAVGIVDRAAARVRPVAWHGVSEDYVRSIPLGLGDAEGEGRTFVGQAVRARRPMVSNTIADDQRLRLRRETVARGFNSLAVLPLLVGDDAAGVLILGAAEPGFFDADEMKLLEELAGDIAFALDYIEKANRLDFLAYYDPLTGLPNRALFHDRLSHQMRGRGGEKAMIAVALLDLERFRRINETLGRAAGDDLLRIVGARLRHANEGVARLGIDVFGVALRGEHAVADVHRAVESIAAGCFTEPFALRDSELSVACRIGVAVYPSDGSDADALLRNAEAALRRSKRSGEHVVFYAPEMNARVAEALATENRLRRALARREFVLHYQPKVSLATGRLTGVEALIRWQDPEKGLVPPGLFIPILEETGLIVPVGGWAIEQALLDAAAWAATGCRVGRVAVNVSAIQLQRKDFVHVVIDAVQRGGDVAELLELEITESLLMHEIDLSIRKLSILRGMGIHIAMDDFGTGYSSLSYLARLPVDTVKVDRSFVNGMVANAEDATIVAGIVALVHSLRLKVIAEGVETAEQVKRLAALGCDEVQGYFYSRPVPAAQIEALMLAGGILPVAGPG